MQINVSFPGGKRVNASFDGLTVATDQPVSAGGEGSAAAPYDLFLASLATCAGYYVLAFCQSRGLPTDGIQVVETVTSDPATHLPAIIEIEVTLPPAFPEKYRAAVKRAAEHCKVVKTLHSPPVVAVHLTGDPVVEATGPQRTASH